MSLLKTIDNFIGGLVHASVRGQPLVSVRHRVFIAPRLLGGLAVLATVPLYLAFRGAPDALEVFVIAWFVMPVLVACYLAATGQYERAHIASSLSLAALVAVVGAATGEVVLSAAFLVAIPLEAALSGARRVVVAAVAIALTTAVGLGIASQAAILAAQGTGVGFPALVGIVIATLYAGGIAFGAPLQTQVGSGLLSSEEERYRLLARYASEVISRHGRNGEVEFMSPVAEGVFGVPARALMGHGLFERVHVADRPAYLKALADAAHGGVANVEFRMRRETRGAADFIWIEMRCRPLDEADASGGRDVVAAMRDVTGRKTQEDLLESARTEAERANAAKGRFLATMSHELRTPLNAIIGFSEMMMREQELMLNADRRQEYSLLINKSGQHLLSVVNDILDMSKMESGTFEIAAEPFAPREPILTCCELMVLKARDGGVALNARVPESLPGMVGDRRALKQVLLNLLSNAIKFTGRDGSVNVSAAVEGASLVLQVEDTGVGIGAEDLKRLGDPFFQAGKTYQRRHEGTGLGLSIVKGLVALQGGELSIQSKVDAGTRVTVRIPLTIEGGRKAPATVATLAPKPLPAAIDGETRKSA